MSTDVILVLWKVCWAKVAQFFYKERRMVTDISGCIVDESDKKPMFLSEEDLQNQSNPAAWRKGVQATDSNIFRSPRNAPEFPRIFQNTPRPAVMKPLPFAYKAFAKKPAEAVARPTIVIPKEETEDPPYAAKTP